MRMLDAWQTGTNSSSRSRERQVLFVAVLGDRDAFDQLHDEVRPARYPVVPASSTLAMFGWSISASACRSASKRAITCRVSMPGLMIFERHHAPHGLRLLGHEDHAHAPFADLLARACRGR